MAEHDFLVKNTIKSTSGLPTDVYVTDWCFSTDEPDDGNLASEIAAVLGAQFWNFATSQDVVSKYISSNCARVVDVAVYDVTAVKGGGLIGSPTSVSDLLLDDPYGAHLALPEEVSIALSIEGDMTGVPETTPNPAYPPTLPKFFRPASRRRGRVFLGPWEFNGVVASTGGHTFVAINHQTRITEAAANLLAHANTASLQWSVWSRTDATFYPVVSGFLDNAFDTIRSRGSEPNGRVIWL